MPEIEDSLPTDDARQDLAGTLAFTDNISIAWSAVDEPPSAAQLAKVNEANEIFLRAVSVLGSASGDVAEEDTAVSNEIARLDLKVNMLLDLVSQLIYTQLDIPPRTQVTIGADSLSWSPEHLPAPGDTVFMQVYIQHGTPKPLCFYGEVITRPEEHAAGIARVDYQGLSAAAHGWLEKLIFRHHRREVAYQRTQQVEE